MSARLDPDRLAHLEDQRRFLLDSLDDLEREHDAGDLDDEDYRTLKDDYTARAAEVIRSIDSHRSALRGSRRPRSPLRAVAVLGGVVVFAVVAGLVAAQALGARKPGESASGGIQVTQSPSQQAQMCMSRMQQGGPLPALKCYAKVLKEDPENPVALTWMGWTLELSSSSGTPEQQEVLRRRATAYVDRAVQVAPDYSYARAFRVVLALRHGEFAQAKRYLAEFRSHDPSSDAEAVIEQMQVERRIDEALKGSGSAGSTTTTTVAAGAGG